jgi:imidazolonepropionase-like amidohydrolase
MAQVLHLSGPVLVGPEDVRARAWVLDGRITYEQPAGDHDISTVPGWVLPGLVDAHSHVGLDRHGATDDATAEAQALADRDAGALLLRDAGSPADTRWVQQRDDLPRLVRAGRHIARTRRYIRNYAWEVEPEQLVDQVRLEAASGDGWVKLVGDWIDRETGDLSPCWPADVLAQAVAAAHDAGARVTAHCFGEQSLRDLAAAGTDCVEHACGLDDGTLASFAEQRIVIVPTLVNIDTFPRIAEPAREKFPDYHRHMLDLHARRFATIAAARDAGIPVYTGTDAGGSLPHGLVATEVAHLAHAGFTTAEALDAACWGARSWLGWPGLEEGDEADLVVYPEDPREDLAVLASPALVVLRGRVYPPPLAAKGG